MKVKSSSLEQRYIQQGHKDCGGELVVVGIVDDKGPGMAVRMLSPAIAIACKRCSAVWNFTMPYPIFDLPVTRPGDWEDWNNHPKADGD